MTKRILAVLAAVAAMVAVPAIAAHTNRYSRRAAAVRASGWQGIISAVNMIPPDHYVGIVTGDLTAFDHTCGCRPNLAVHYVSFGLTPNLVDARIMLLDHAAPLLELEPYGIPLASIIAGREDRWLSRYAVAVQALHAPVLMSFAPEANGTWYTWGFHHVSPVIYVRAWRHVVRVFRKARATDIRWVWIMNTSFLGSESIRRLWPGDHYVDLLGIDGYLVHPTRSVKQVFSQTLAQMRALSGDPVMITETAASPTAGKLRVVRELAAEVAAQKLAGFIWFDVPQQGSLLRQDWRLETVPSALAAFRNYVRLVRTS